MNGLNRNTGNTTLRSGMLNVRVRQTKQTTKLEIQYLGSMRTRMETVNERCREATGYDVGELVAMSNEWNQRGGIDYLWTVNARIPTNLL